MTAQARWNLVVSRDTDNSLRQYLASQGRGRKGELSRFVEDAVRARIFEAEVRQAKEENRSIQRQLAELEAKLRQVSVVSNEHVPDEMVYLGHTVRLLDLDDDTEQLVKLVGEAQSPTGSSDVLPVSVNSRINLPDCPPVCRAITGMPRRHSWSSATRTF